MTHTIFINPKGRPVGWEPTTDCPFEKLIVGVIYQAIDDLDHPQEAYRNMAEFFLSSIGYDVDRIKTAIRGRQIQNPCFPHGRRSTQGFENPAKSQ